MQMKAKAAIIGSGNIGTDLMYKILRTSKHLEAVAMVGIDPESDGLARAKSHGLAATHKGVAGLIDMPEMDEIQIVFDATSAAAHKHNYELLSPYGVQMVDLTPAAIGPYTVPVINMDAHLDADNVNLVTCGGQATIPMVAAVSRVSKVHYAEIVASVSSRSAGPGTRANIDEFTQTTARGIEKVGGASEGKAIIILNPAEPPMLMRNTIFALHDAVEEKLIIDSVNQMVQDVCEYVPGYRLKQEVQFEHFAGKSALNRPGHKPFSGMRSSIFIEVEGAGHYFPTYAGNLDIMTSAALATGERLAREKIFARAA
jgi:acetaldehyde dehydrogenase